MGGLQAAGGGALHRHAQHGHGEVLHPSGDLQPGDLLNLAWQITLWESYTNRSQKVFDRDYFL